MYKGFLNIFLLAVATSINPGCEIINPDEPIPSYIHISTTKLETNAPVEGSSSHRIPDIWIFVNDNPRGVYELPASFPVIGEGFPKISIIGGILENGISTTRKIYPFYASYILNNGSDQVELENAKTDTILPVFEYKESTTFAFMEDFENVIGITDLAGGGLLTKVAEAFEGISGLISLDDSNTTYEGASTQLLALPANSPVYVELNYKSNNEFQLGVIGNYATQDVKFYKLIITPKTDWNKIYVNLEDEVTSMQANTYQLLIKAEKQDDVTGPKIYLDNIKVLTF